MKTKTIEVAPYEPKYFRYDRVHKFTIGPYNSIREAVGDLRAWTAYETRHFAWGVFAETKGIAGSEYVRTPYGRERIGKHVRYCVVDEFGDVVSLNALRESCYTPYINHGYEAFERQRKQTDKRLTKKHGGSHKIKSSWAVTDFGDGFNWNYGGCHRQMKTTAEHRANTGHTAEYRDEFPNLVRAARSGKNLPNSWDDYPNGIGEKRRSWKHHSKRRKQWKPK